MLEDDITYSVINFKCFTCGSLFALPKDIVYNTYELECPDCNSPYITQISDEVF